MDIPTTNQSVKERAEEIIFGAKCTFTLPSGYSVTIREQNGGDDDILSNKVAAGDLSNLRNFISSIVISTDLPMAVAGKLTPEACKQLLLRDKYTIIVQSRIHSYGPTVKLKYDWGKKYGGILEYEEDLTRYIWDYSTHCPTEGEEGYDEQRIIPYGRNPYEQQTLTLTSGKELRWNYLDGNSELELLQLPATEQSRNTEIKARRLQLRVDDKFVKVDNFTYFTRGDMAELHKFFKVMDPGFSGITELQNPNEKDMVDYMSVLQSEDFFYPGEI